MRMWLALAIAFVASSARAGGDDDDPVFAPYHRLRWELAGGASAVADGSGSGSASYSAAGPYVEAGVRDHELALGADYRRLSGRGAVTHRFGLAARYHFASWRTDRYNPSSYESLQAFVEAGVGLDAKVPDAGGQHTGGDALLGIGAYARLISTDAGRSVFLAPRVDLVFPQAPSGADVFRGSQLVMTIALVYGN